MMDSAAEIMRVDAHNVWGTQSSVDPFIRAAASPANRAGSGVESPQQATAQLRPLSEVLQQLLCGSLQPSDFPSIRVVYHDGRLYSLDNRRLWLFHQLAQPCLIEVQLVQPAKEFWQKFTNCSSSRTPQLRTWADTATAASAASCCPVLADDSAPAHDGQSLLRYNYTGSLDALVLKWSEVNICNKFYFNDEQVGVGSVCSDNWGTYQHFCARILRTSCLDLHIWNVFGIQNIVVC
eukprot:GHUV01046219.1.p1 GENE.GHUV01046219.1~~GHUV01046219.1.p1  ORF type:complete len:236 (-),score=48.01 GHUV01046219.1:83-790(-)